MYILLPYPPPPSFYLPPLPLLLLLLLPFFLFSSSSSSSSFLFSSSSSSFLFSSSSSTSLSFLLPPPPPPPPFSLPSFPSFLPSLLSLLLYHYCRKVALSSVVLNLYGSTTVHMILISQMVAAIIQTHTSVCITKCHVILIVAACLIPLTWLGSPKDFW